MFCLFRVLHNYSSLLIAVLLLVNHSKRHVSAFLIKVFRWVKSYSYCWIEFEERDKHICVFIWCWDISLFRWVCEANLNRFSSNVNEKVIVLGRVIEAIGINVQCWPRFEAWWSTCAC